MKCLQKERTFLLILCLFFVCYLSGCTERHDLKEYYLLTKGDNSVRNMDLKLYIIPKNVSKSKKLRLPFYWVERKTEKGPYKIRLVLAKKGDIPKIAINEVTISTNLGKKFDLLDSRKLAVKFEPPPTSISAQKDFIFSKDFNKEINLSFKEEEKLTISIKICFDDECRDKEVLSFEFEPKLIESVQVIPLLRA